MEEAVTPSYAAGVEWARAGSSGVTPMSDEPAYTGGYRTVREGPGYGYASHPYSYAPSASRIDGGPLYDAPHIGSRYEDAVSEPHAGAPGAWEADGAARGGASIPPAADPRAEDAYAADRYARDVYAADGCPEEAHADSGYSGEALDGEAYEDESYGGDAGAAPIGRGYRSRRLRAAGGGYEGPDGSPAAGEARIATDRVPGSEDDGEGSMQGGVPMGQGGSIARASASRARRPQTDDEVHAEVRADGEWLMYEQQLAEGRKGAARFAAPTPKSTAKSAVGAIAAIGGAAIQGAPGTDIGDDSLLDAYGAEEGVRTAARKLAGTKGARAAGKAAQAAERAGGSRFAEAEGAKKAKKASSGMARLRAKINAARMAQRAAQGSGIAEKAGAGARILQAISPTKAALWPLAVFGLGILLVFALFMGLSSCAGIIGGIDASEEEDTGALVGNEAEIAQFLIDKGYDTIHVAAILGNMRAEAGGTPGTSFNTGAVEYGSGAGHGICQWTGSRWDGAGGLLQFAQSQGKEWTELSVQLDFLWTEIQRNWIGGYTVSPGSADPAYPAYVYGSKQRFDQATDLTACVEAFCYGFERPGIPHITRRVDFANQYYEMLNSSSYVEAALRIAEDDSHGYSMASRTFNPDVDCSSFIYYSLLQSGYTTEQLGGYPFTTFNMGTILVNAGFEEHVFTGEGDLKKGDILVAYDHTEMYIGNGQLVGAHEDYDGDRGDSSGREVSVVNYYQHSWHHYYRKGA